MWVLQRQTQCLLQQAAPLPEGTQVIKQLYPTFSNLSWVWVYCPLGPLEDLKNYNSCQFSVSCSNPKYIDISILLGCEFIILLPAEVWYGVLRDSICFTNLYVILKQMEEFYHFLIESICSHHLRHHLKAGIEIYVEQWLKCLCVCI